MTSHTLPERDDFAPLALIGRLWSSLSDHEPRVGAGIRTGLSIGTLCLCLALLFLLIGLVETSRGGVDDEYIFLGMGAAAIGWSFLLYKIWSGYRQWKRPLRTVLVCVNSCILTGGLAALVDAIAPRAEALIGAVVLLGLGIIIAFITQSIWESRRLKAMRADAPPLRINCPDCGYSMSDLESAVCPECGRKSTLDALIRAQSYVPTQLQRTECQVLTNTTRTALLPPIG